MKRSIVIVEDESIVALEIGEYIAALEYEVLASVKTAKDAIEAAQTHHPFAVLMDINLKGEHDGIEAALAIKKICNCAIIYLTAYHDTQTIARAAATEPAGYLVKPFNRDELRAALTIAYARQHPLHVTKGDLILDEEYSIDTHKGELFCCAQSVHLTRRERELLMLLAARPHTTVDTYTIENTIWPEKAPNENTRRALVSRLRAKLNQRFIETVAGMGYRISF